MPIRTAGRISRSATTRSQTSSISTMGTGLLPRRAWLQVRRSARTELRAREWAWMLLITNFSNQMAALYQNEKNGLFVDEAAPTGIGRASLLTLGFGCFFFDYDLDGWPDIFIANGHIETG